MAMASPDEVTNLTGLSVGESDVVMAQGIIELFVGRTEAVFATMQSRDRYWLKMAVVYQCAWMQSHPEVFSIMDVAELRQVDLQVSFREGDPHAAVLAPLARKALRRVSWKGTRTIEVTSAFQAAVEADTDDAYDWQSL